MKDVYKSSMLYDFYGELLTEHQKEIYEDFILNDYSLGEIAQERGISRQGVHDMVKRCDRILNGYEEKLHLVERFSKTKEDVRRICQLADSDINQKNISEIKMIAQELLGGMALAFESLSDKLQNIFKNLRSKGRLTEDDVKAALKEVKIALLEADVSFKVVKDFIKKVQERAVGQDVMSSLTPGQMVIKIVNEELTALMGSETTELKLLPDNQITVIMMMGLQGAGKTTTTAKIAGKVKDRC